jgi:quercetin dioxygenase-like cupin family protein
MNPVSEAPSRASIRRTDDRSMDPVTAGTGTSREVLTPVLPGSTFHMRRFVMEPGGGMPRHTNTVEHQQYVLRGEAQIVLGEETHRVRAGDVVHIPAGVPHSYRAEGNEPFEFLCAVPNQDDRIDLVDEGC